MRIELTIPDDYIKRNLYVFAGLEPVARRQRGKEWEVKTQECSRCGQCCLAIDEQHPFGSSDGCIHLKRSPGEQMCRLNIFRPHGCAIADGSQMNIDTCTVRWGLA